MKDRTISRLMLTAVIVCSAAAGAVADDLIWTPVNPSFGGSSFNASWLMQQAEAQNKLTDKSSAYDPYKRNALEDFSESMNRQILSRLSSRLIQTAFGESDLSPGHYEIGDYIIDIGTTDTGIKIDITDPTTGTETSMEIPYY